MDYNLKRHLFLDRGNFPNHTHPVHTQSFKEATMKIEFADPQRNYEIKIIPENQDEALELARWDNCIISSKFDYNYSRQASEATLTLIKEI